MLDNCFSRRHERDSPHLLLLGSDDRRPHPGASLFSKLCIIMYPDDTSTYIDLYSSDIYLIFIDHNYYYSRD